MKAKLFWTGRSQAVRLPKEFRFDGDTVVIRRAGNKVILEAIDDAADWREFIAWLETRPLSERFEVPRRGKALTERDWYR